jgi:SAM-dependent methyltransferase
MSRLGEAVLTMFCKKPNEPDYAGATARYTVANALDFAKKTIPGFIDRIQGQRVLDYGCGPGYQAVAMALAGAREVVGVDINSDWLAAGRELALKNGCSDRVKFEKGFDPHANAHFDVAISLSSFEHFADSASELATMIRNVKPGGLVIVSFAEPWLSHNGSHMGGFAKIPWVNVLFSEQTVMNVRSRYRDDGARKYEDVRGGLNRMTLRKFESIVRKSGAQVEELKYHTTLGLPAVDRVPVVREFLVSAATCLMRPR